MMQRADTGRMWDYFLIIWVILTLNFFLPRAMPGDPFLFLSADGAGDEVAVYSDEQRNYYRESYGLERPLWQLYGAYLAGLARGNLGESLYYHEPVARLIGERLPWTFFLVLASLGLSTVVGTVLGGLSALYRESRWERGLYLLLTFVSEVPPFLMGIILLFTLAAGLGIFPLSGAITHFGHHNGWVVWGMDMLHHAVLPVSALTLTRVGGIYLLARGSFITVLGRDYMRTARAKGLSRWRILVWHGLANAMLPIVTKLFLSLGSLVGGAVFVESVFSYPGLGMLIRDAVRVHDYPLVQGVFLVVAACVLSANFLADRVYVRLDPRVARGSFGGKESL